MAFAPDPNQPAEQNLPGATGMQPVPTSAAPGAGPGGSTKAPTGAPNQQAPAQPFTNLHSYLTANQPQVQQQADTIAGNLTNQYGQVQSDINAGTTAFNNQVGAGYAPDNPTLIQQAAANPAQFVQTPGNTQAFKSILNDQYSGPSNFEGTAGYTSLNNEVTQDAANAALVNTPAGLQTYLEGSETNPTQGENLLDSVLLNQSPAAIQEVQAAATPFSQLPTTLANDVTTADQGVTSAQAAATAAQQDAQNSINPTVTAFEQALASEVPAAQAQENAYNQTVNANAAALNPINTALNSFDESTGLNVTNPLTAYLAQQPVTTAANSANVATPAQYAEDAALAQLLGTGYTPQLNQANAGEAGTFSVPTAQTENAQSLAQQIADAATQAEWGTVANSEFDNSANPETYQQLLNNNQSIGDQMGATTPAAQESLVLAGNVPGWSTTDPYETLLNYLQQFNPSGFTTTPILPGSTRVTS